MRTIKEQAVSSFGTGCFFFIVKSGFYILSGDITDAKKIMGTNINNF